MQKIAVTAASLGLSCLFLFASAGFAQGTTDQHRLTPPPANPCETITNHRLSSTPGCGAAAPVSHVYYAFCFTGTSQPVVGGPLTMYLSEIFLVDPAVYVNAPVTPQQPSPFPWVNQFSHFISQTYPRTGNGGGDCQNFNTEAEAREKMNNVISDEQHYQVVVKSTGWKYTSNPPIRPPTVEHPSATPPAAISPSPPPVAPAAVPASQPAVAPVAPSYAVCFAERPQQKVDYVGAPFHFTGNGGMQAWAKQYRDFLQGKYGNVGRISCKTGRSLEDVQQQAKQWEKEAGAANKIVETGWKYQ